MARTAITLRGHQHHLSAQPRTRTLRTIALPSIALAFALTSIATAAEQPWATPDRTWHADVTIDAQDPAGAHREHAVWQLEAAEGGFCVRVTDVRKQHDGGTIGTSNFDPLQLEGSGWCRQGALRTVGTDAWAGATVAERATAAGLPPNRVEALADAANAALALQQHLAGILLFDAWRGGRHALPMPNGQPLHVTCRSQPPGEEGERMVACEGDTAVLRKGMAHAASLLIGMDAGELEQAMRADMPDGPFVIVLQGTFAADTGLPQTIAWIPDQQLLVPGTRFTFEWARGPALAPELPLDPQRPWIEHPEPPPGADGSRAPFYRANRAPKYPADALMAREEGEVVLRVLVGKDGRVHNVQVHHSSGSAALDAAAQDDVAYWLFHPAMENGTPVERQILVPVNFSLVALQGEPAP